MPDNAAISKRQRLLKTHGALKNDRSSFDSHWRELADYFFPRRTRFVTSDRNKGDKRSDKIINSTGKFAARTLQSGLHAGLTSPARPWLKLTTPDQALTARPNVKAWLRQVTERMLTLFAVTNAYNALPIVYGDLGVFGTGCMAVLEDSRDLFRCYTFPLGSYWLGTDNRQVVTTFVREYQLTVRQLVREFGTKAGSRDIDWSNISQSVRDLWDRGDYEQPVDLLWVIEPNEERQPRRLEARYSMPWSSCHLELGNSKGGNVDEERYLRESGFRQFPIMAPRWDVTGEDSYGTDCPGMTALGDCKQLQSMERTKGKGIAKQVDPPLVGPAALRSQKTSLLPGDVTYVDVRDGMAGLRSIHDVNLRVDHLVADISRVEYRIQRAFFEDLFLMLARSDDMRGAQPVTAREVEERHEEKLLALGPVLERTNDELLDPFVDRIFNMMALANLLPPIPQELEGVDIKAEYISILAEAQKLIGVVALDRFVQTTMGMAQIFPGVVHKVNVNQAVDNYADMLGIDPRVVNSNEVADGMAQQQAKAAQDQADAEQLQRAGAGLKAAAGAQLADGTSALDKLVGAAGAPALTP